MIRSLNIIFTGVLFFLSNEEMTTPVIADVDINIYKPVEKALLTESNLIILQKLLYSPHDYCKIFKVAICGSDFRVQITTMTMRVHLSMIAIAM